jgi:hypothetical protein
MVFQQPVILWGLFLLSIPILIHFLNFRKSKTVYFSSLRFIDEVKSTYRKRNRLTDLLLLLLRLLVMACLIIAFAQPVIPARNSGIDATAPVIGLYIDNSQSMQLTDQGESLLNLARKRAIGIIEEFPPGSRFRLLYNASPDELGGITDKELTLKLIEGIHPSADQLTMDDILRHFQQGSADEQSRLSSIVLISDFQESLFNKPIEPDTPAAALFPIRLKPAVNANISIDTCWLDDPMTLTGQNNSLSVIINNRSDQDYEEFPVRLVINDTLRNETAIRLPANSKEQVSLGFHPTTTGWQSGSVQISDFPVVFDNELAFSFRIESEIPVLLLSGNTENPYLKKIFGEDPYFKFESFGADGFPRSDFGNYNLVILSGIREIDSRLRSRVQDFLATGGTVWLLPELEGDLAGYNDFLNSLKLPGIQGLIPYRVESGLSGDQNEWLKDVVVNVNKRLRLPYFNQSLKIPAQSPDRIDLLNSLAGDLLLSQFRVGKGSFVLSGFPLDEKVTDFMFHPLFIPICYRIAVMSKNYSSLYQLTGLNKPFPVTSGNNPDNAIKLINNKINFETIPVQQPGPGSETILYPGYIPSAGLYSAMIGTDTIARIAFNYSREESELSYLQDSLIVQRLKSAGWNISLNNNSQFTNNSQDLTQALAVRKAWYLFLIVAFFGLLAESFVMHRKK